jgi:Peptidase family M28
MLDPRIYRTGLVAVVVAVIVFAFSLRGQQGPIGASLAPDAFNAQYAFADMNNLASHFDHRRAGSPNDGAIAAEVAQRLGGRGGDGFNVQTQSFNAATPDGTRTLQNVIGIRAGLESGSVVVIAHRDSVHSPAYAEESGTAVLLDLARVLAGETIHRTVVLVSTSGSTGAAGATQLIRVLPKPIDAVIVLGDMASAATREPIVVPWSSSMRVAPPQLRNTVAAALSAQTGLAAGGTSLAGQFIHLAFPLTVSEQAPFGTRGIPAVLLSASGERGPSATARPSVGQIARFGRTALEVVTALDAGPQVAAPSTYFLLGGNVVPAWAIQILVLGLIIPVLVAAIDGYARARRRGHQVGQWVAWVLEAAAPFVLGLAIVLLAKAAGVLDVAPPSAAAAGGVPLHARGIVLLAAIAAVILLSFLAVRRWLPGRPTREAPASANPGAAAALLLVLCAVTLAIWVSNPFAAALLVPALHLWMWVVAPEVRLHPAVRLGLLVVGMAPVVLAIVYYMVTLGYNPIAYAWNIVLMIAGGQLGIVQALEWSVALGCVLSVGAIAAWAIRRQDVLEEIPVTVRGPITYAGPGSLGGTESALRR